VIAVTYANPGDMWEETLEALRPGLPPAVDCLGRAAVGGRNAHSRRHLSSELAAREPAPWTFHNRTSHGRGGHNYNYRRRYMARERA
jgi:hypothetical protein